MDSDRFDRLVRTLARENVRSRRGVLRTAAGGVLVGLWTAVRGSAPASAQVPPALCPEWVLARYPWLCEANEPNTAKNTNDNKNDDDKKDNDKKKDKDNDEVSDAAVCPAGSATLCCQCRDLAEQVSGCTARSDVTECETDCGGPQFAEVLVAPPGEEFTCVEGDPPRRCQLQPC